MSRLPALTADKVIRALRRAGWEFDHTSRGGSHRYFRHPSQPGLVTVAYHAGRTLKRGTLASILRQANLSRDEFLTLL
jgi:predicted RNA binding protein YcfA (HicA-like mRNA interferase family)